MQRTFPFLCTPPPTNYPLFLSLSLCVSRPLRTVSCLKFLSHVFALDTLLTWVARLLQYSLSCTVLITVWQAVRLLLLLVLLAPIVLTVCCCCCCLHCRAAVARPSLWWLLLFSLLHNLQPVAIVSLVKAGPAFYKYPANRKVFQGDMLGMKGEYTSVVE